MSALRAIALLALLLLAPLASALPLAARSEGAHLVVELGPGLPEDVLVVVTHNDGREWLDRAVRVHRDGADAATSVRMDGLPREVALTVRIFPGATTFPGLPGAPHYLDASAIARTKSLAETTTGPLSASADEHVLPVQTVGSPGMVPRAVHATASGDVVLVHLVSPGSRLAARFSHDGGRTFGGDLLLTRAVESEPSYRTIVDHEGKLVVIQSSKRFVDDPDDYAPGYYAYEPWQYLRVDPTTERVLVDTTITIRGLHPEMQSFDVAPVGASDLALAWNGALQTIDSAGRTRRVGEYGVHFGLLHADGSLAEAGDLAAAPYAYNLVLASSPGGALALAATNPDHASSTPTNRGFIAIAPRGLGSFGAPRNVTDAFIVPGQHGVASYAATIDDALRVNALFARFNINDQTSAVHHVRIAADGTLTARDLTQAATVPNPHASPGGFGFPLLAQSADTVWLSWGDGFQHRYLQRSSDAGATWSTALLLREADEPFLFDVFGVRNIDVLPDGRPVILGGGSNERVSYPYEPRLPTTTRLHRVTGGAFASMEGMPAPSGSRAPPATTPAPPTPAPPTSAPPPAKAPMEGIDIIVAEPATAFVPLGGQAALNLTLRNTALRPLAVEIDVTGLPHPFVFEPGALELQPGETLIASGFLRLADPDVPSGRAVARIVAKPEDASYAGDVATLVVEWQGTGRAPEPPVATTPPPAPTIPTAAPARPTPAAGVAALALALVGAAFLRRAMVK